MTQPGQDPGHPTPQRGWLSPGLVTGALLFAGALVIPIPGLDPSARHTAAVAVLMAAWWMTEAIPLAATALIPLALFPLLGVLSADAAAAPYANPVIFLFLGGFILALALERWELHRRIALTVVGWAGTGPRRLVGAVMGATAFISMWISNTATAAMMLPIALALARLTLGDRSEGDPLEEAGPPPAFATALMLGVAYAASLGGLATLIGTPPNAVFAATASELLGVEVGFAQWMALGLPATLILLPITWAVLVYLLYPPGALAPGAGEALRAERQSLAPLGPAERRTLFVFAVTVAGWLFREPKAIAGVVVPGLSQVVPGLNDATIAIAGALLLFLLPSGQSGGRLMDWDTARRLPWGVLILFGGGLSLATALEESGLTVAIGSLVEGLAGLPPLALIAITCGGLVILSELASNTAIAAMSMPILAAAAVALGGDPLVFMAAGALASSAAFMLPVATPPNAIVFGSGYIGIGQMVRAGVWMNVIAWVVITLLAGLLGPRILG